MQQKRYTDDENAIFHMLTQYRGPMQAMIASLGSPEAFMEFVGDFWQAQDERAQRPSKADYGQHTVQ